uniref:ATP phosphoribosyltransferase n=1 Tax=Chromera velia CCMP2878 TaxID=1169474 RepID=A0A0G4I3J9_9ALVE|mmetsp:Transcript_52905/g.103454  ORF Transcript_52905/g.103454 Transcript_52905/m.103454 type:complete len:298 (+) Transcript_52905:208-1101(+)|eukprot:Cvel_1762.t1-p1 / transcript=Cvel_1762.t1 / gene=Cvel_1762 / organism=Chromera_velia_CCMP2878 / gene_product=ATP phosphoribosyltransferase, putative / transcript_product=ATP phosphoribosyltransferase, putative / location=Cvel_scaffold64:97613-98503(+) / protein_length=297 / sequence_SO=supercontig / SO=protein_coding / is_pseudo=false
MNGRSSSEEGLCELKERCLFAIPKKGRLHERCMKLLAGAGVDFVRLDRQDIAHCSNLPMSVIFLPASDIPKFVCQGNVDMGITGQDVIAEDGVSVTETLALGFGKCKLAVQAPIGKYESASQMAGKRIVTSFPRLTEKYFEGLKVQAPQVLFVSGSVEASVSLGLGDAIVDLVETGATMKAAGLEIVETIMETEATLVMNKNSRFVSIVEKVKKRIEGWMTAQKYVLVSYNVHESNKEAAIRVTPGMRSPNVTNLVEEGWFACSAMVLKKNVVEVIDALSEVGAKDILVTNIDNFRA